MADTIPSIPEQDWNFANLAKSFGSGLRSGGGMVAGLPGDFKQLIAYGHDQYVRPLERLLGYKGPSPEKMQQVYAQQPSLTPTSPQIAGWVAALLGAPYQPQTENERLAYRVGEKLPQLPLLLSLSRGR
jgi:hypothetical protein